jgi:hypothetical protein
LPYHLLHVVNTVEADSSVPAGTRILIRTVDPIDSTTEKTGGFVNSQGMRARHIFVDEHISAKSRIGARA